MQPDIGLLHFLLNKIEKKERQLCRIFLRGFIFFYLNVTNISDLHFY